MTPPSGPVYLPVAMSQSHLRLVVATLLAALFSPWVAAIDRTEVRQKLAAMPAAHPRILLNAETERALKQRLTSDPVLQSIQAGLLAEADRQLVAPPMERVLIGRRLLDKSRPALSRMLHLGLAWRLTGQARYLDRGRTELTAVAAFPDWNPSHFLDVAIGYDWFYPALDEPTRTLLRAAIVEKGLKASLTANAWTRVTNNWNQVCNAGITLGALAVAENEAELSADLVTRALNTVQLAMHEFEPDGASPEGRAIGVMARRSASS